MDDFYLTSQKLTILETTNMIYDNSAYNNIVPASVPYWARVIVANRMATSNPEWHALFYQENSGTYNNQWMTVDYKLFTPGMPMPPDTFWVSEQLPNFHIAQDQTMALQRGHWPSYNVPFYEETYTRAGYPKMVARKGPTEGYQLAPRATIFRRDAEKVYELQDMKHFMRLNRYNVQPNDPLFPTPATAIAARADLMPPPKGPADYKAYPGGAIDCKIVSSAMAAEMTITAVAGPTSDNQPVFRWDQFKNATLPGYPHHGQMPYFGFPWQTFAANAHASSARHE